MTEQKIEINEKFAQYLGQQYGPKVEERYRKIALNRGGPNSGAKARETREGRKVFEDIFRNCAECGIRFQKRIGGSEKFCGRSCAAKVTQRKKKREKEAKKLAAKLEAAKANPTKKGKKK
ncbi:hypothetical protein [Laspinema palackyanum]|uniref:hypothetical protein n=1 Tax=Laspinema palackyanum TaxID=3231601 RepID=UPI00345DD42F|nr:hypothetical protein [Laspinema sp. D2c]